MKRLFDWKMKWIGLCQILYVLNLGTAQQIPDGPYLGQSPPGLFPEIFAPDFISLPDRRDTKVVFSPDGQECFVGTVVENKFTLLYTKIEFGHWSELLNADFLGSADKREPFIAPDGQILFFARNADIWFSTKSDLQWSNPSRLASPISTSAEEWHPTVTHDGTLYFCSTRTGSYNIYRSRLVDNQYSEAEPLDVIINSQYGAWDPFIAPDESYMVFSTTMPDGFGNVDQYIAYSNSDDDSWSEPRNLGHAINTNKIEYGAYVTPDNQYFFFSRPDGWGAKITADIYWVSTEAIFTDTTTDVDHATFLPYCITLEQNYPNPFNPSTTLSYILDAFSPIKLTIYNVQGQLVRTLVNTTQSAGEHSVLWDGMNSANQAVSSGIYLYRLETDSGVLQRKMMLIR